MVTMVTTIETLMRKNECIVCLIMSLKKTFNSFKHTRNNSFFQPFLNNEFMIHEVYGCWTCSLIERQKNTKRRRRVTRRGEK